MENSILTLLQQPGASFSTGSPNWTNPALTATYAGATPQYSQGLIDFWINEGYKQLMGDLDELEIGLVSFPLTSTVQTYKYAIPPATYAAIASVGHIYYQPVGLTYIREFRPGTELISWAQFQRYTSQGWLEPYSFATLPNFVTVDPLLQNLYFFPGCANAGDSITIEYTPFPTASSVNCPTLVNASDVPVLPVDTHIAIVNFALSNLWVRAREAVMAGVYEKKYQQNVADILRKYARKHHGDTQRLEAFGAPLSIGGGVYSGWGRW